MFHQEITFFVRTFFFVFLGIIFSVQNVSEMIAFISILVLLGLLIARYISARLLAWRDPSLRDSVTIMTSMLPRGMAASVTATLPLQFGIAIAGFVEVALLTIIMTNIVATIGIFLYERKRPRKPIEKKHFVQPSPFKATKFQISTTG